MKKHLLRFVVFTCLFLSYQVYTEEIRAIGFLNPVCNKIDGEGLNLLSIRIKFEQIFQNYSAFKIADISNEDNMARLQAESEMIGGLETADAVAYILLEGMSKTVAMQLKVVDAKTNTVLAIGDYDIEKEDLYNAKKLDEAIGAISVKVLQALKVDLSATTIAILKGEKNLEDLSSKELNEQVDHLNSQISNIKKQIEDLKQMGKADANLPKINKLQIELDKWETKKKIEEMRLARKAEDEKRRLEESETAAKRSKEANERILAQTKKYEQYANRVRKEQMKALSALQQIEAVEDIKQKLLSMRMYTADEIEKVKREETSYAEQECKKIDDEPLHSVDKDADGNPIPQVVAKRAEQKKKINSEAEAKIKAYVLQAEKKQEAFEKQVVYDIKKNYAVMEKTKTINSVNDADVLRIRIGNYDGVQYGWRAQISFDLGYKNVVEYSILIPYKSIFKKRPNLDSEEYRNNVEDYDSFFRNNIPVLYASVDYSISPLEKDKPSQYLIKIFKTKIYRIETDEGIPPKKIMERKEYLEGYYEADIISDIRTAEEVRLDEEKARKEVARQDRTTEKEISRQESAAREERERIQQERDRAERAKKTKEIARNFFKPAWTWGLNVGVQTLKFNYDSTRFFINSDLSMFWPLFLGLEMAIGKAKEWNPLDSNLKSAFQYIDAITGVRLGYRFFGIGGWFSPYLCASGGLSVSNWLIGAGDGTALNKGYTVYVAGTTGFNFLTPVGIFGLSYSCEYNVGRKALQHFIGFSIGINIVKLYNKNEE